VLSALVRTHPWLATGAPYGGLSTKVGFPSALDGADPDQDRATLRLSLARALAREDAAYAWARQVHGGHVLQVNAGGLQGEADALVSRAPGPVLLVSVADCCPVLAWDTATGVYGVAHAGWRGVVAGVLDHFSRSLVERGAELSRVRAWIGPSIGPCCFEVGHDVAAQFEQLGGGAPDERAAAGTRPHIDLRAACSRQLFQAGIAPERVAVCPDCTACRGDLYFSFRRDRGICGRHLGYLAL
jgi:YfiH family protein